MARLPVKKTYKLFIGGAFPRSESRAAPTRRRARTSRAPRARTFATRSRAARAAQPKWAAATAYNRGQVLYRIAEMMEARAAEFAELCSGRDEVERSIDRIVWYAGFADKLAQVLGSVQPGRRAVLQLHDPRADRRRRGDRARRAAAARARLAHRARARRRERDRRARLRDRSRSPRSSSPRPSRRATSPAASSTCSPATARSSRRGSPRTWTSTRSTSPAPTGSRADLEAAAAENVKRVVIGRPDGQSLAEISSFLELKTVWHPIGR